MADHPPDEETGLAGLLIGLSNFVYYVALSFGLAILPFQLFDQIVGGSGWMRVIPGVVILVVLIVVLRFVQDGATDVVERIRNGVLLSRLFRVIRHASAAVAMVGFLRLEVAFLRGKMTWPDLVHLIGKFFTVL